MRRRRRLNELARDRQGAAAAEMALVTPLLLLLMFGSFELGKFFWDAHIVAKAVRDGARFASRRAFSDYSGCAASSGLVTAVRNVTRTGFVSGTNPLLSNWTDATTVTVTVTCASTGVYRGVYEQLTGMGPPVVTVEAAVPYSSLFRTLGFNAVNLTLRARSQAAVAGL